MASASSVVSARPPTITYVPAPAHAARSSPRPARSIANEPEQLRHGLFVGGREIVIEEFPRRYPPQIGDRSRIRSRLRRQLARVHRELDLVGRVVVHVLAELRTHDHVV